MENETQPQTNTLADKLAAAKAAAAASVPENTNVPSTAGAQPGTAVANAQPTTKRSLTSIAETTFTVDKYIKVNEFGFTLEGKLITDPITVLIDLSEVIPVTSIKAGSNPTRYDHTYDGVMAKSGKTWAQAVEDMQKIDPKARPYESFEICLQNVNELKVKEDVVAEPGDRIGYATSTTGKNYFVNFIKEVARSGVDADSAKVFATITALERTGNGNTWGVIDFKYEGPYLEN